MELVVASSLFIIVAFIATGAFVESLRSQRSIRDLTSANNNASQALEMMAREIRTGFDFVQSTDAELNFTNYRQEKVSYKLLPEGTIGRCVSGLGFCLPGDEFTEITSEKYSVSELGFYYGPGNDPAALPPRVTISITIEGVRDQFTTLQTTVSSKNFGS